MIILTTPVQVPSSLGATTTVAYNKLRCVNISADPVGGTITCAVQLLVSTNANAPIISGSLAINLTTTTCTIQVPTLNFYSSVSVTGEVSTIQGWINTLQNAVESGLITEGLAAGVQSTGV